MRATLLLLFGLTAGGGWVAGSDYIVREARRELLVPGYTAFDWLACRVDGGKVTLP